MIGEAATLPSQTTYEYVFVDIIYPIQGFIVGLFIWTIIGTNGFTIGALK